MGWKGKALIAAGVFWGLQACAVTYQPFGLDLYAIDRLAPVRHIPVVGAVVAPAPVVRPTDCGEMGAVLATIREQESGGNYTKPNPDPQSGATGAYQFINKTWNGYGGFTRAMDAPPAVQDAKAREHAQPIIDSDGVENVPLVWYLGHVPSAAEMDVVPAPEAGNTTTPRQYQQLWMAKYQTHFTPCPELAAPLAVIRLPLGGHDHSNYPAVDIQAERGSQFVAIAGGTVSFVGGSCGLGISIENDGTSWKYCHADKRLVNEGDVVAPGSPLGLVGMTGNTNGPHLHLELDHAGSLRCPQALVESLVKGAQTPTYDSLPTSQPCPGR